MVPEVKDNLDKIINTCKQMQVKSLYMFGSGSRESDFTTSSDLDFIFEFVKDKGGMPLGGSDYFDLLWKLEEITGRKVDLVAGERIRNKYFLQSVNLDKIKIYEA